MGGQRKSRANMAGRERIVAAMMELLREKPLSAISVSELTARAGVSRMTFYRNYGTKEEVMVSRLGELVDAYREDAARGAQVKTYFDRENLTHCFAYFSEYREFLEVMLNSGLGHEVLKAISGYILERWFGPGDGAERYYTLQAFAGAIFQVYLAWSVNGAKETPEELAGILYRIYTPEAEREGGCQRFL